MDLCRVVSPALLFLLGTSMVRAQDKQVTFEVGDVKLNTSGGQQSRVTLSNGRFLATNVPLRPLIAEAWTITPDAVVGPSWLDDVRVDLAAKARSPQTADADIRLMVRSLLEDRMKLVAHTENREQRVFALMVWKGKAKLTPADAPRTAEEGDCSLEHGTIGTRAVCRHMTMIRFAHDLPQLAPRYLDQRVVDQTQLEGAWDFSVEWAPLAELDSVGGLSLFAALQAQLGLELKAVKLPVPVLVIDSMERAPTAN